MWNTFEQSSFFMPVLLGSIFCLVGLIMFFLPPKKINPLYGYRTPRSMKSQERWDFAQGYSAKLLIASGVIMLLSGMAFYVLKLEGSSSVIAFFILLFGCLGILIYKTESLLKKTFKDE